MKDIKNFETFVKIEPLNKGLSKDKKFYVETNNKKRLLLRISDISEHNNKETIFNMMKRLAELGISMPLPVDFGICNDSKSVYQLLTWCDGESLEMKLPLLSETEQYRLGLKAGDILRKIHSVQAPDNLEDWAIRYNKVNGDRIESFKNCGIQIQGSEAILRYYEDNKHLLNNRPQCFHHGDYHYGNFLINDDFDLSIIDWEMLDYDNFADPWEEFNRIGNSEIFPYFSTGMIRGYFYGEPPREFWRLLALYLSAGSLMLVSWAFYCQKDCLEYSKQNVNNILIWFDNMNNPLPTWYLKNFHFQ